MITKLRRNFIIVAMCSMFAVLVVIVGALNIASYVNLVQGTDEIIEILAENNARFPMDRFGLGKMEAPDENKGFGINPDKKEPPGDWKHMYAETPYETRYFVVRMAQQGTVITVDTGKIAAIRTEQAMEFAEQIWESQKEKGFIENYRFRVVEKDKDIMILFIDRTTELASLRTLFKASLLVSIAALAAVLLLVIIFSKKVFRPVAATYEKQKQFITDASHELKTPITIISANVEILEMEGEENSWTRSIKNQVERLTTLTEQMVTLSRMDEEKTEKEFHSFSFSEAFLEAVELYNPLAQAAGKELLAEVEAGYVYNGDEKQIRQMLSLLLDNAMKYSSENGRIEISLKRKGRRYQLSAWNTVEEIPTGDLNRIFERFYRLDSSRSSATGGTGIGLSIVKSIVELHGGKITAFSEDGKSIRIVAIL